LVFFAPNLQNSGGKKKRRGEGGKKTLIVTKGNKIRLSSVTKGKGKKKRKKPQKSGSVSDATLGWREERGKKGGGERECYPLGEIKGGRGNYKP